MKRALLTGINTYHALLPLAGCVNDVNDMKSFLLSRCGFTNSDICVLVNEGATTLSILNGLQWLVKDISAGDRILFHFSGHGARLPFTKEDAICPYDFDWTETRSVRNSDFSVIFNNIPDGVEFIWISDSCHSGNLFRDLEPPNRKIKSAAPSTAVEEMIIDTLETVPGPATLTNAAARLNLALIAACRSSHIAEDGVFNGRHNGALTYYLLQELQKTGGMAQPLTNLVERVKDLLATGFSQVPELEGSPDIAIKSFLALEARQPQPHIY